MPECLSFNHRVATCWLDVRCRRCFGYRHMAKDCKRPRVFPAGRVDRALLWDINRRPHHRSAMLKIIPEWGDTFGRLQQAMRLLVRPGNTNPQRWSPCLGNRRVIGPILQGPEGIPWRGHHADKVSSTDRVS